MKDDRVVLRHIQDALAQIALYTASGREAFLADRKTQDTVVRSDLNVVDPIGRIALGFARLYGCSPAVHRSSIGFEMRHIRGTITSR